MNEGKIMDLAPDSETNTSQWLIQALDLGSAADALQARQCANQLLHRLGIEADERAALLALVTETAWCACQVAGGKIEFLIDDATRPQQLLVRYHGEGLVDARDPEMQSDTARFAAGQLVKGFQVETASQGEDTLCYKKMLPPGARPLKSQEALRMAGERLAYDPGDLLAEVTRQDQDYLRAMNEAYKLREELAGLHQELSDTNRGVVALFAELDESAGNLRAAQAALASAVRQWQTTFDAIHDGIALMDANGIILRCNQAFTGMMLKPKDAVIGQRCSEFTHFVPGFIGNQDQARRETAEAQINGRWFDLAADPLTDEAGRQNGYVLILTDVTERKQAEDALRASEERLQLATGAAGIGIWDWDIPQDELTWNEKCKAVFGLPPDAVISYPLFMNAIHPDDRPEMGRTVQEEMVAQKQYTQQYRVIWPDGSVHWVLDIGKSYIDRDGKPVRMTGIAMDITRQKQAEEKLEENAARLESLNYELQHFALIASHDLQEPLRKIRVFSERLSEKARERLTEGEQDYIARVLNAVERMQTMIEGLLAYSRITTKAQPHSLVNLNQVVSGVLSDLEIRIEQSKGNIDVGDLPSIEADELQIRLLFQNLISNALKFSKPGIPPRIRIYGKYQAERTSSPSRVEIAVEDDGIGFDMALAGQLFQPFHRLVGRSEYEGTGMGLAICRKIVERHGGSIIAHSNPGQGTTFIVTLPVKQKHQPGD